MVVSRKLWRFFGVARRRTAHDRVHGTSSTYVRYAYTKPQKNAANIIDQIYVPTDWRVNRWTTLLGTKNGVFTKPRASDHLLVWASLTGP